MMGQNEINEKLEAISQLGTDVIWTILDNDWSLNLAIQKAWLESMRNKDSVHKH